MVITAATPMIIPSIVRPVRILLWPRALSATLSVMKSDMSTFPSSSVAAGRSGGASCQRDLAVALRACAGAECPATFHGADS